MQKNTLGEHKQYKIFLSHASADKSLVTAFLTLLRVGLKIADDDVFCTSKPEGEISQGEDFSEKIQNALKNSESIVCLITPKYLERPSCSMELGAALIRGLPRKCFRLNLSFDEYRDKFGFLAKEQNGLDLSNGADLDCFADDCRLSFTLEYSTASWNQAKEKFLESVKKLPKHESVSSSIGSGTQLSPILSSIKAGFDEMRIQFCSSVEAQTSSVVSAIHDCHANDSNVDWSVCYGYGSVENPFKERKTTPSDIQKILWPRPSDKM